MKSVQKQPRPDPQIVETMRNNILEYGNAQRLFSWFRECYKMSEEETITWLIRVDKLYLGTLLPTEAELLAYQLKKL